MRPSWHDPEARRILEERKAQRDNEYLLKQIGDATYLRSLMILGYLPSEARTALSLLRMSTVPSTERSPQQEKLNARTEF